MSKITAKKSLGQNFLKDETILGKIIQAAEITSTDNIIEVGPGKGALTEKLLQKANKVIAYELDQRMIEPLSKFQNLELHLEDILEADIPDINFKLVANIPYYITSPIINKFLKDRAQQKKKLPQSIILLIQREVAEKICSDKNSVLSLNVKTFGTPEIISIVKPECFNPAPKVDSAILKISNIKNLEIDLDRYFKLIHQAFKMPRKTIWNNLKNHHPQLKQALEELKIDLKQRPETLSKEQFHQLSMKLF